MQTYAQMFEEAKENLASLIADYQRLDSQVQVRRVLVGFW